METALQNDINVIKDMLTQSITSQAAPQKKEVKINFTENMTNLIKSKHKIVYYAGAFYLYKDGYYQKQENKKFKSLIKSELPIGYRDYNNVIKIFDTLSIDEQVILDTNDLRIEPIELICFKNCIYNLLTNITRPHTSNIIFFTQIPHSYNPIAKTNNMTEHLFNNFIKGYSEEDKTKMLELIYQVIGVALSNDRTMKNFFFIQGIKDTGKSTLLGLIKRILGEGMYSSIPIKDLRESGTSLSTIIGKKANILTETTAGASNDDVITTLKKLTGGCEETISCKIKFKSDVEVISRALLIFAGNSVPSLWSEGDLNAFIDRMILVDFKGQIKDEEKIANILEQVNYEYIIAEAIRAYNKFITSNRIFTVPSIVIEHRNRLKNDNPVASFINECSRVNDYKIHAKTLFLMFQEYCAKNACSNNISQITFTKKIEGLGFTKDKVKETEGDKRAYVDFTGLKPPKEYLESYLNKVKSWSLSQ